jgi:recombination associated protein RdgC
MFKNAILFRVSGHTSADDMNDKLAALPFLACAPTQARSLGWVPPRGEDHGLLVESVGGQWIIKLMTETRTVPTAAVKKALDAKLDAIEKETGRRPRGKIVKELKEEVVHALMPQAFPKQSAITAWLDPKAGVLVIDTPSMGRADDFVSALVATAPGLKLRMLQTTSSPASVMGVWLAEGETGRADVYLGRRCELKQPDGEKAGVRYVNKELDIDEVKQHIQQGMGVTSLALGWAGRVDFTLTPGFALQRIRFLEVVFSGREESASGFDADVAILTGELPRLVAELVDAMGGELAPTEPAPA